MSARARSAEVVPRPTPCSGSLQFYAAKEQGVWAPSRNPPWWPPGRSKCVISNPL